MDIEARFNRFDRQYSAAIAAIQSYLRDENDDVRLLVNWLMTTNINPYGFLPEGWAGAFDDAVGFASLCNTISHALVDDGEINFVTVNGEPRISFAQRDSDRFEDAVLTTQERDLRNKGFGVRGRKMTYKIAFLDGVAAFIEASARHEVDSLRKCFLSDARRNLDSALEHYGKNPLFRTEWVDEAAANEKAGSRRL